MIDAVQDDEFIVIYHNCGNNTIDMIESILRVGAAGYHFGNSIDMRTMLEKIPAGVPGDGQRRPRRAVSQRDARVHPAGDAPDYGGLLPGLPQLYHLLRMRYPARHALGKYRRVLRRGGEYYAR